MPYITKEHRDDLDSGVRGPVSAGELAYVIAKLVRRWVGPTPDYATLAAAAGILETAKLEYVRQLIEPYEDKRKAETGGVY